MIPALPSLANIGFALRSGPAVELATALVDCCLDRIDRYDDRVRAWVHVDREGARREAQRLGRLLDEGKVLGPLHGVPIGIKDIIDVAGMPTRAGSPLRSDYVARDDAPVIERLRRGGAIILGKTVTTELACFDPSPTRNPWNLSHTPGGSSSGSAAAVSLEMCLGALGSQTGGSIIRPAAYCGVAGLKPTFGSVNTRGVVAVSPRLDHVGPIARCVEDLYRLFCVVNESPRQPMHEFTRQRDRLPRLCVFTSFFAERADQEVREAFSRSLRELTRIWPFVESVKLPSTFDLVHGMHRRIMAYEAAQEHRIAYTAEPTAFGPNVASLIEEGLAIARDDYREAIGYRDFFHAELMEALGENTIVVLPSTTTAAPPTLETTGDPQFNSPWSFAGVPEVTIPCDRTPSGMPVGLQLIGPSFSDARLLNAALAIERQLKFKDRPPLLNEEIADSAQETSLLALAERFRRRFGWEFWFDDTPDGEGSVD